jgi:glyoxylase-like metal-dependent hydrolase (beta-lactamase superfamily II)
VFVVEHEEGLVLFDTGMSGTVATDPEFWPDPITRFINNRVFRFHIGPEDTLTRQLELAGFAASDVKKAVISHLHFDHAGCISEIPQAELFVATEAWEHMLGPHPERKAVLRRDIEIEGANWTHIPFEPVKDDSLAPFTQAYDLMGDGSMMVIPTPGHMPGSVSMLVRTDPPLLFVGDLCYSLELLMQDQFPGIGDEEVLGETFARVRKLIERMPDLMVMPAHDVIAEGQMRTHPLFSG